MRVKQVYTAGGMPEISYVERQVNNKSKELLKAIDTSKLITLTGNTKTGKTVLVNKHFPKSKHIWIDSGTVSTEDEFWELIAEKSDEYDVIENETEKSVDVGVETTASAEAGIILAKGKVEGTGKVNGGYSKTTTKQRNKSKKIQSLSFLAHKKYILVIDDFHYLDKKLQQRVIRSLKGLVFEGLNVICIAIPHRKYDAILVEREMNGRVIHIAIPQWTDDELILIGKSGENTLNIEFKSNVLSSLASNAFGSPHLMQDFIIQLLDINGIEQTQSKKVQVKTVNKSIFKTIAEDTGKEIFSKLATGPSQRKDRKPRKLKNGDVVDIYQLMLLALIEVQPGMIKLKYIPEIRNALRKIIDDLPQVNEISRVFDKMKEIALSENSSVAVLDWNKQDKELIITDPFFAFYLYVMKNYK